MRRIAALATALLAGCAGAAEHTNLPAADLAPGAVATNAAQPHASTSRIVFKSAVRRKVTVTERHYAGHFVERNTCNPLAGEIAAVSKIASSAGSATYSVRPEGAGICTIDVSDATGKSANIVVKVTTAAVTVH